MKMIVKTIEGDGAGPRKDNAERGADPSEMETGRRPWPMATIVSAAVHTVAILALALAGGRTPPPRDGL